MWFPCGGVGMTERMVKLRVSSKTMRWLPYEDWLELHALIKSEAAHYHAGATSAEIITTAEGPLHRFIRSIQRSYGQ